MNNYQKNYRNDLRKKIKESTFNFFDFFHGIHEEENEAVVLITPYQLIMVKVDELGSNDQAHQYAFYKVIYAIVDEIELDINNLNTKNHQIESFKEECICMTLRNTEGEDSNGCFISFPDRITTTQFRLIEKCEEIFENSLGEFNQIEDQFNKLFDDVDDENFTKLYEKLKPIYEEFHGRINIIRNDMDSSPKDDFSCTSSNFKEAIDYAKSIIDTSKKIYQKEVIIGTTVDEPIIEENGR